MGRAGCTGQDLTLIPLLFLADPAIGAGDDNRAPRKVAARDDVIGARPRPESLLVISRRHERATSIAG